MAFRSVAALILIATAPRAVAENVLDIAALTIVRKHCVVCLAARPTHESFSEVPEKHDA